ncbi:hypothetical protein Trydic_g4901 [Trypoxylus dichotomus]
MPKLDGYILSVHTDAFESDFRTLLGRDVDGNLEERRPFVPSRNMTRTDLPQGESDENFCEYKESRISRFAPAPQRYHRWHNQYPFGDG